MDTSYFRLKRPKSVVRFGGHVSLRIGIIIPIVPSIVGDENCRYGSMYMGQEYYWFHKLENTDC